MREQIDGPKQNESRSIANHVAQKKGVVGQEFVFEDNRPVNILQRNTDPQIKVNAAFSNEVTQLLAFESESDALVAFRKLIQGDEEGEHIQKAKEYLAYAQDKKWDDLEDEAIEYVRMHEDFDTSLVLGDVDLEETEVAASGPGVIKGGAGTTKMNVKAFWDVWQPSQRDTNIRASSVEYHVALFKGGGDADPPFFERSYLSNTMDFTIRTSDGRHRITAAKLLGIEYIYVLTPNDTILNMADIVGLKTAIFPDL